VEEMDKMALFSRVLFSRVLSLSFFVGMILVLFGTSFRGRAEQPPEKPSNEGVSDMTEPPTQKATFGAGCFWGVEAAFQRIKGVVATQVGYSGGALAKPTYKDVCSGRTGHAEVVQIEYDPSRVKYEQLLKVFWENHDPTQLNRQGPDWGEQYRSVIFFHTAEQEEAAKTSKEALERSGTYRRPVVTQIIPASEFYRAEEYHQRYLEKRGLLKCHVRE